MEDTVSCFTDTIMVVMMKDVGRAFEALMELIDEEKRKLNEGGSGGPYPFQSFLHRDLFLVPRVHVPECHDARGHLLFPDDEDPSRA